MRRVSRLTHSHVLLRRVEDVGHPGALQVVQVAHRLPIADYNTGANLKITLCLCYEDECSLLTILTLLQSTGLLFS